MAEISIPGVNDKYKTQDLVKSLMEVEKLPLKREQERIEGFRFEQESWRRINQFMGTLRESARELFSFNNPFNDKQTNSSDPSVLSVTATRDANIGTHKIQVETLATADKFLSADIEANFIVEKGTYSFSVGEKDIKFVWKGGPLVDFVDGINKRSSNILKASVIGSSGAKKNLLLESLVMGKNNPLILKDDSVLFAENTGMIKQGTVSQSDISLMQSVYSLEEVEGWSAENTALKNGGLHIASQNAAGIIIDQKINQNQKILSFSIEKKQIQPLQEEIIDQETTDEEKNLIAEESILEQENDSTSEALTALPEANPLDPFLQIKNSDIDFATPEVTQNDEKNNGAGTVFLRMRDGREIAIDENSTGDEKQTFELQLDDFAEVAAIVVKNNSPDEILLVSDVRLKPAPNAKPEIIPLNPISTAGDAVLNYQGIKMVRSSNQIDDVIPHLTLNLEGTSEKPITIDVKANLEGVKDSLITFVGQYNRLIAEINVVTQSNPAIISELQYLSDTEQEDAEKRLSLFQGDFSLTNNKATLQNIVSSSYARDLNQTYTLLSQIGISTKSSSGGITQSQLRGYLEIEEKKLDDALATNMNEVRNLFGYDSTGDLVSDSGIGVLIDKNLHGYLQIGGILTTKTQNIDSKIKSSQTTITRLERQIESKEVELRRKYGQMESTLRNLEGQSSSISNFNKSNTGN
ncbi:MAG: flagellar filament capping protein FliD [Treponemataceae bacterium]